MRANSAVTGVLAMGALVASVPGASAQTIVQQFELQGVMLLPDISHPGSSAQPMTGRFQWVYEEGDFENGSGQFLELDLPWTGFGIPDLNITIETEQLEGSLNGNYHDLGVDWMIRLVGPFSPEAAVGIDPLLSTFDIQSGISHQGHVISGLVVPVSTPCAADFNQDGQINGIDVGLFLQAYGTQNPSADMNNDGSINGIDVGLFLQAYGGGC